MGISFSRALGAESGVQLNPLVDNSAIPDIATADTVFAIPMRLTRGRIDKAFLVNSGNYYAQTGSGETIRTNALNEAWVQSYEALANGATQAVVARLVADNAVIKKAVVLYDDESKKTKFAVAERGAAADPTQILSLTHFGCFNDGIKVVIHADEKRENGKNVGNDVITLGVLDSKGNKLAEYTGSLLPSAVDDYNNSFYLPDIIGSSTDMFEVEVNSAVTSISTDSDAYGFDANGRQKRAVSGVLVCFLEGSVGKYSTASFISARRRLELTPYSFGYISSGGSQNVALLGQLAILAHNTNKQLRFDVSGKLTPEQAIVFVENLGFYSEVSPHLLQAFWAPLKSADPSGINGSGYIGTSALNIAYACRRNTAKNAKGFAPKHYPIAGSNFPINRKNVIQTYTPESSELSKLASAKINPVIYQKYNSGSKYVFFDSLTCAPVKNSLRKLISVADMSTSIDEVITAQGNEYVQLPISIAIKKMKDFLQEYFEGAYSAGWLVPSNDAQMNGASFKFHVMPVETSPNDQMSVEYWLRFEGTARQIYNTQILTR